MDPRLVKLLTITGYLDANGMPGQYELIPESFWPLAGAMGYNTATLQRRLKAAGGQSKITFAAMTWMI